MSYLAVLAVYELVRALHGLIIRGAVDCLSRTQCHWQLLRGGGRGARICLLLRRWKRWKNLSSVSGRAARNFTSCRIGLWRRAKGLANFGDIHYTSTWCIWSNTRLVLQWDVIKAGDWGN